MSAGFAGRLRARLAGAHPDHRRIARGAAWVSLFVLLGKSAGALKEMAIAYRYGVSGTVDAYQFSFALTTWIPSMLVTVFSTVLIPVLVRMRGSETALLARFVGELRGMAWVVGIVLAGVLTLASNVLIDHLGGALPIPTKLLASHLIVGLALTGPLTLLICIEAARLQARERHVNTLLEAIPAAVLFIVVMLSSSTSVTPLYIAVTLGFALQVIFLARLAGRVDHARVRIRLSVSSPQWRELAHSIGVLLISQAVLACIVPVDQYMATLHGGGAIATLGYANRLIALLLGVGASAIGRATLPVLTEAVRDGHRDRARAMALKWACIMFAVGVVAACVASVAAPLMVRLLFERGAFTATDTAQVSTLLRWCTLQLPSSFATLVLMQLAASEGRYRMMACIISAGFAVKICCNFMFAPLFGLAGLPAATAAMYCVIFGLYFITLSVLARESRRLGSQDAP